MTDFNSLMGIGQGLTFFIKKIGVLRFESFFFAKFAT